jgi:hypothetical protein
LLFLQGHPKKERKFRDILGIRNCFELFKYLDSIFPQNRLI